MNRVQSPDHYKSKDSAFEVIDFIEEFNLNFNRGNIVKYICRAGKKENELEDLLKAKWYLEREIAKREIKS